MSTLLVKKQNKYIAFSVRYGPVGITILQMRPQSTICVDLPVQKQYPLLSLLHASDWRRMRKDQCGANVCRSQIHHHLCWKKFARRRIRLQIFSGGARCQSLLDDRNARERRRPWVWEGRGRFPTGGHVSLSRSLQIYSNAQLYLKWYNISIPGPFIHHWLQDFWHLVHLDMKTAFSWLDFVFWLDDTVNIQRGPR